MASTLEPYVLLWTTISQFYDKFATWMTGPFYKCEWSGCMCACVCVCARMCACVLCVCSMYIFSSVCFVTP